MNVLSIQRLNALLVKIQNKTIAPNEIEEYQMLCKQLISKLKVASPR
jgi:uncharacterized protein YnzC (UPF0291/DUF896 family)